MNYEFLILNFKEESMANVAVLRGRVAQGLADTGNAIWSAAWLDEGLRLALAEYNLVRPVQTSEVGEVALGQAADNPRELILTDMSIDDVVDVTAVWLPYTPGQPEHPPNTRRFEYWPDVGRLYLPDGPEPRAGEQLRLFVTRRRQIEGLDTQGQTTLPPIHESMLVGGAAGHVAASRALDLAEQVTLDKLTAQQVRAWGLSKLQEFRAALSKIGRRQAQGSAFTPLPPLDRWDKEGWA
jgi:hypothetical protein